MTLGTNLLLAVLWASLIGPFSASNLLVGTIVGYVFLRLCGGRTATPTYVRRVLAILKLSVFTVKELIVANIRVAWYTVSNLRTLRPAVLRVPLEPESTDAEITLLSTLITLTPGTLTIDVAEGRDALFVHVMHVDDTAETIREIKQGFERRILEVTR